MGLIIIGITIDLATNLTFISLIGAQSNLFYL